MKRLFVLSLCLMLLISGVALAEREVGSVSEHSRFHQYAKPEATEAPVVEAEAAVAIAEPVVAVGYQSGSSLSSLGYEELVALKIQTEHELMSRPEAQAIPVPMGVYEVGPHIPVGDYTLTTDNFASIIVSNSENFDSYENMIYYESIEAGDTIGRINLKEGTFVHIEYGIMNFTRFAGLGF